MKIFLPPIILISLMVSCKPNEDRKYLPLLKGNWKQVATNINHTEFGTVFSFQDSVLSYDNEYEYSSFLIKDDTIISDLHRTDYFKRRFQILSVTNDTLLLKVLYGFSQNGDTLLLTKLKPLNNIVSGKIYYINTYRNGTSIEIDSAGNFIYYGHDKNLIEGGYKGVLPKELYQNLQQKIKLLPLDSLKLVYDDYGFDDGVIAFCFKEGDKIISAVTVGSSENPEEFSMVNRFFYSLYGKIELRNDTTITEAYFYAKPELHNIYKSIESIHSFFHEKQKKEAAAFIKQMKLALPKIEDKKLRELKKEEIALMEKVFLK